MTRAHLVERGSAATWDAPGALAPGASGLSRWSIVDDTGDAVHTGFGVCHLEAGGAVPTHVHAFEESVYVLEGEVVLRTPETAVRLVPGDYALIPVGTPHAWQAADGASRWADMLAPQPRSVHNDDTWRVPDLPAHEVIAVDPRDPRTRSFGSITADHMDATKQSQKLLAVSASMRTALLVYSGITVKMMVDGDLGSFLQTMFMVQYEPNGFAGPHDHPFEEAYLILEGETDAVFDGHPYRLKPGDIAWAGVGCTHEFSNPADRRVRWLETQAPQPPGRHSYRFARDWRYLGEALG